MFLLIQSRLDDQITNILIFIFINDYNALRRDSYYPLHIGLTMYVHKPVENKVIYKLDSETEATDCIC